MKTVDKPSCAISFANYVAAGYVVIFEDGAIKASKVEGGWFVTISTWNSSRTPFVEDDFFEKFLVNMYPSL